MRVEKVVVTCPICGRVLLIRGNDVDSKSAITGTTNCIKCRKKVRFTILGARVYTS